MLPEKLGEVVEKILIRLTQVEDGVESAKSRLDELEKSSRMLWENLFSIKTEIINLEGLIAQKNAMPVKRDSQTITRVYAGVGRIEREIQAVRELILKGGKGAESA